MADSKTFAIERIKTLWLHKIGLDYKQIANLLNCSNRVIFSRLNYQHPDREPSARQLRDLQEIFACRTRLDRIIDGQDIIRLGLPITTRPKSHGEATDFLVFLNSVDRNDLDFLFLSAKTALKGVCFARNVIKNADISVERMLYLLMPGILKGEQGGLLRQSIEGASRDQTRTRRPSAARF